MVKLWTEKQNAKGVVLLRTVNNKYLLKWVRSSEFVWVYTILLCSVLMNLRVLFVSDTTEWTREHIAVWLNDYSCRVRLTLTGTGTELPEPVTNRDESLLNVRIYSMLLFTEEIKGVAAASLAVTYTLTYTETQTILFIRHTLHYIRVQLDKCLPKFKTKTIQF